MKQIYLFFVFLFSQIISTQRLKIRDHNSNDYINLSVNRTIDLRLNVISITTKIIIKSLKIDPIYFYRLPILKNNTKSLIRISAKLLTSSNQSEEIRLKISKQIYNIEENFEFYEINFNNEPMNQGEKRYIEINEDYFQRLEMLPKKITLNEDQLVVFKDTLNHVSFYQTNSQKTKVLFKSKKTQI